MRENLSQMNILVVRYTTLVTEFQIPPKLKIFVITLSEPTKIRIS